MSIKTIGAAVVGAVAIGVSIATAPAEAATFSFKATSLDSRLSDFTFGGDDLNVDGFLDGFEISAFSGMTVTVGNPIFDGTYDVLGRDDGTTFFSRFSLANLSWESTSDGGISFPDSIVIFDTLNGSLPIGAPGVNAPSSVWTYTQLPATPIPTPALLPGLIGMGIAAWKKRKGEQSETVAEPAEV